MQTRYSPPGEPAARAGRPPHTVGRRNANSMLPTRRARCAGWPTSPHGGEANASSILPTRRGRSAAGPTSPHGGEANASSILPTRRGRCAGWPTPPHGGEAKCKLDTPHPASPLRGLADLPTWWGGEMQTRYSPPGEPAARAGRPPHRVGRRNANSILPTPASPLRGLADLPTRWGGEMQTRYSPPGEPAARAGRPPHTVGRRNANSILPTRRARCAGWPTSPHGGEAKCKLDTPHPARPLRGLADLPTRWGGEMQARYSPPGAAAPRPGRPPHTVGRRKSQPGSPLLKD